MTHTEATMRAAATMRRPRFWLSEVVGLPRPPTRATEKAKRDPVIESILPVETRDLTPVAISRRPTQRMKIPKRMKVAIVRLFQACPDSVSRVIHSGRPAWPHNSCVPGSQFRRAPHTRLCRSESTSPDIC